MSLERRNKIGFCPSAFLEILTSVYPLSYNAKCRKYVERSNRYGFGQKGKPMYYYPETEMQYILVVRCVKCGNEARGRGGKQASAGKCPMWNLERVEDTGKIANVYYVAQEAESVPQVG